MPPYDYTVIGLALAIIDGKEVHFGYCLDAAKVKGLIVTKREADKLSTRETQRYDKKFRVLEIKNNELIYPERIPIAYLIQLELLGYDSNMIPINKITEVSRMPDLSLNGKFQYQGRECQVISTNVDYSYGIHSIDRPTLNLEAIITN
jgi:hypothetical protein